MPQMAPTNWLLLFIYFIMCFYIFNVINYYTFFPKMNFTKKKLFMQKKMNWKW